MEKVGNPRSYLPCSRDLSDHSAPVPYKVRRPEPRGLRRCALAGLLSCRCQSVWPTPPRPRALCPNLPREPSLTKWPSSASAPVPGPVSCVAPALPPGVGPRRQGCSAALVAESQIPKQVSHRKGHCFARVARPCFTLPTPFRCPRWTVTNAFWASPGFPAFYLTNAPNKSDSRSECQCCKCTHAGSGGLSPPDPSGSARRWAAPVKGHGRGSIAMTNHSSRKPSQAP